jgi:hypothetical protein
MTGHPRRAPAGTGDLRFGHLALFFLLTFALTWGLGAALVVFPDQITAVFGELSLTNPLYLIMT